MKKKLKIFMTLLFFPLLLLAQGQVNVKGKIVDEKGEPIVGATIVQVGNNSHGTVSDIDGQFTINMPANSSLEISYIGYITQTVRAAATMADIVLKEDNQKLEEVVVIGYQSVRKADLTGAVSVFKPETMKNTVVTGTVADALATMPGLFVRTSGQPGAEGFVQIRGTSTFGTSNPLYVIDGIALGTANRDFNYNDIESIQVLKDASAAAIYGSRAANGVIIITTKKGKEGKMKINVSAKNTFQWLPRYNLTNREQWIKLNDLAFNNGGRTPANHADGNTNWQEDVFKTGVIQDYDVSFSGGNNNNSYFIFQVR